MPEEPKAQEGWTWIVGSPKWHYIRKGVSLCGKWMMLGDPKLEQGNENSPDNCAQCRKARAKELTS